MEYKSSVFPALGLALATVLVSTFFSRGSQNILSMKPMMHEEFSVSRMAVPSTDVVTDSYSGGVGMSEPAMGMEIAPDMGTAPYPYYPTSDALSVENRSYTKSAFMQVVVADVADYIRQQKEFFLSIDGRVLSSNLNTADKYKSGYLYVKVPVAKFEEATGRVVSGVKEVVTENISVADVTGQVVYTDNSVSDIENQIVELQSQLEAAVTTVEKNRIELQIKRMQEQLKQAQANQTQMTEQTEYAVINLSAANNTRYFNPMGKPGVEDQFEKAWESLSDILYIVGVGLIWLAVYAVLWLPVVIVVRWLMMKKDDAVTTKSKK